ncbi:hypothetical protein C1878_00825 [Gordonibacter sp. 28C]|uniref:enoyl-CoA hydratase/isomerase family protein n=1 Tax=Gordonibacter sp. 28C TaxID=2078569 RepID=UPI000DF7C99F|nr:enoyl-CoA hydratase/isomerase family protein [Gordonibacter sp. 28C]RDB64432.1 hypothetical protein C1878_00825 [Gordonibacter sp. 28C]
MDLELTSMKLGFQSGLATITFTQAKRGNPIDATFCTEMNQVVQSLANLEGLRAILLLAEGKSFSFGGDLVGFKQAGDQLPGLVRSMLADMNVALSRLYRLPAPTVVGIQGFCMGGMIGLVAGCDYVVAGESTKLGAAFSGVGFSIDTASSSTLTMRMGTARARRFELMAEMLTSSQAAEAGLVDEIVPDDDVVAKATEVATRLASGPTQAYAGIKELFLASSGIHLEQQSELEATILAKVSSSEDSKEGVNAMLEKRKPSFSGK